MDGRSDGRRSEESLKLLNALFEVPHRSSPTQTTLPDFGICAAFVLFEAAVTTRSFAVAF